MNEKTMTPVKTDETTRTHRGPFALLDELRNELDTFWQRPWTTAAWKPFFRTQEAGMAWMPKLDVFKKDGELVVKADLPGLKKEDVKVYLEEGDLVVEGVRKEEKEIKAEDYFTTERTYGTFYRRLPLTFEVDPGQVKAQFTDGVLEVRFPMPAETKAEATEIPIH
jgi:HSP20 family protein